MEPPRRITELSNQSKNRWVNFTPIEHEPLIEDFDKAIWIRQPTEPVIFHIHKGGQYKAKKFRGRLLRRGFRQSMTGKDPCLDNAFAESFFGTLKTELIHRKIFECMAFAEATIFEYMEVFY